GRNLLSDQIRGSGRVWYIGLEDPREEYERRLVAIAKHYGIEQSELDGRFFLDTGREQDFVIAREEAKGLVIVEPVIDAILANIREKQIDVLAVDPSLTVTQYRKATTPRSIMLPSSGRRSRS